MIELLLSVVGQRGVDALAFLLAFALTALMDSVFHDRLPHDHGREFAVNGALSKGKARGSGLIFVLCIALVSMAFLPVILADYSILCPAVQSKERICRPVFLMPKNFQKFLRKRVTKPEGHSSI